MHRKLHIYCFLTDPELTCYIRNWRKLNFLSTRTYFHFPLVQWGKYIMLVENTAWEISINITRLYLRMGEGKNFWAYQFAEFTFLCRILSTLLNSFLVLNNNNKNSNKKTVVNNYSIHPLSFSQWFIPSFITGLVCRPWVFSLAVCGCHLVGLFLRHFTVAHWATVDWSWHKEWN